jgi:hypothetical protein
MAVIVIANDNTGGGGGATNVTATDTLGNTWTRQNDVVYDPGSASAGVQGAFLTTNQNGGTLTTGTVITVSFAQSTTAKAWTMIEVFPSTGKTISFSASTDGTGSATASPTVTTGSSITSGNMVIGGLFNEQGTGQTVTGDADTSNGSWSTQQTAEVGATDTGMTVSSQYKVVTGTATQTFNPTLGVSSDVVLATISLTETDTTAPTIVLNTTDGQTFNTATPGLETTATDAALSNVRYNLQISTAALFQTTETTMDSYPQVNRDADFTVMNDGADSFTNAIGQTFTATAEVFGFGFFVLSKSGSPTGNAVAKIYNVSGGVPSGAALATSNNVDVTGLTTTPTLTTFTFNQANQITLSGSTTYALTIEYSSGNSSNYLLVGRDNSTPSHAGTSLLRQSSSWITNSNDVCFFADTAITVIADKTSGTDSGFLNTVSGGDTDPFNSGEKVSYTTASLADDTYYWKARAIDPTPGSNTFSSFTSVRSFIVASGAPSPTPQGNFLQLFP